MRTLLRSLRHPAFLALILTGVAASAADLEREARLARDLRSVVRAGEPMLLDVPEPVAESSKTATPPETGTAPAQKAQEDPPEKQEEPGEEPIPVPDGLAVESEPGEKPQEPEKAAEPEAEKGRAPAGDSTKAPPGPQVFALYMPPADQPERGGVVLLHDLGGHPDWPEVVAPLRRRLPQDGWATLAVQMPLPTPGQSQNGPLLKEAVPRIEAAVAKLTERGHRPIVLIGHGTGAAMAAAYLERQQRPAVAGAVVVNPGLPATGRGGLDLASALGGADIPVLNLYGSEAPYYVLDTAEALGGGRITKVRILGAGYDFNGMRRALMSRIRGWLRGDAIKKKQEKGGQEGRGQDSAR